MSFIRSSLCSVMDIDVCVLKSTRELFSAAGEKREKALPGKGEGKGPFFPEEISNANIGFHFGLLSSDRRPLTMDRNYGQ